MDLEWGDERSSKFITNLGLITSKGKIGDNISTIEWTHQISYSPGLVAISIHKKDATYENIVRSKQFGINIASIKQNSLASLAGNNSGNKYDKISALRELGFEFFKAKKIKTLMVKDSALQMECKLVKKISVGDHILLVGEIVYLYPLNDIEPLAMHKHGYFNVGKSLDKPSEQERAKMKEVFEKYKR